MASVYVYNIGSTSFSVRLTGLQTVAQGANYTRQCVWSVFENPSTDGTGGTFVDAGTSYIEPITSTANTSGGDYTFSGKKSECRYKVTCTVYRTDTNQQIATLESDVFTTTSSGGGGGGDSGDPVWIRNESSLGTLSTSATISRTFYISAMNVYVYSVIFSSSGYAHFYTAGSVDTKGYLSDSIVFVNTIGEPIGTSLIAENDDSFFGVEGYNFRIREYVNAGSLYYIWVRGNNERTSGTVTLNIEPPPANTWTLVEGEPKTISNNGKYSIKVSMSRTHIYRYAVTFTKGGIADFTDGQDETVPSGNTLWGFITTGTGWDSSTGEATDGKLLSMNGGLYKKNVAVKAGDTYYLWMRESTPDCAGRVTATANITFTANEDSIPKWDWYSSNGDNTIAASQTISAYNAINGTGTGRSTRNFSHLVWDDMVDKVKAICDEAVGWWDSASYGLSYANTKAIANANGEYVLTSNMFNSLRNNLEIAGYQKLGLSKIPTGISSGTIPHPVNSGDTVYGHYFITLTDYMNSCIDKL